MGLVNAAQDIWQGQVGYRRRWISSSLADERALVISIPAETLRWGILGDPCEGTDGATTASEMDHKESYSEKRDKSEGEGTGKSSKESSKETWGDLSSDKLYEESKQTLDSETLSNEGAVARLTMISGSGLATSIEEMSSISVRFIVALKAAGISTTLIEASVASVTKKLNSGSWS